MRDVRLANTERVPALPPAADATPLVADDLVARCLLRRAQGAFQKWPEGFAGFRASVRCELPRGVVSGVIGVSVPSRVEVDCEDPAARARLQDMLRALVEQRTPRFFDDGDGRFPICFGDGAADPHGRPIDVHAQPAQLRYWIDGAVRVRRVERIARGLRVSTTFDEIVRATPGRVLPARTTTSTWDLASGALLGSESVHDSHRRIEHIWLPVCRRIAGTAGDGTPLAVLTLEDHELL
jgi:hypothetical protein